MAAYLWKPVSIIHQSKRRTFERDVCQLHLVFQLRQEIGHKLDHRANVHSSLFSIAQQSHHCLRLPLPQTPNARPIRRIAVQMTHSIHIPHFIEFRAVEKIDERAEHRPLHFESLR